MKTISCLILVVTSVSFAFADEKLAGIACRSVHLGYQTDKGSAFAIDVTPKLTAEGTYFCAIGFNGGYFGIQEQSKGKKVVIFSVWDPTKGDDKNAVPVEKRVTLLHKDDAVRIGRFGGEGTGGQSFMDFDWSLNETYRFLVHASVDPNDATRTAYTGYFFDPKKKQWIKLVTFSTIAKSKTLSGFYSFVEDFKRNKVSATIARSAEYGNAWLKNEKNEWVAVSKARFTADSNPALTIDAGLSEKGDRFFLSTGGKTDNKTTKLKETITLKSTPTQVPNGWPELK